MNNPTKSTLDRVIELAPQADTTRAVELQVVVQRFNSGDPWDDFESYLEEYKRLHFAGIPVERNVIDYAKLKLAAAAIRLLEGR